MKHTKTDWDKIDAMTDNEIDYSDSPELTEGMMRIAFIRKPMHKKWLMLYDSNPVNLLGFVLYEKNC